MILGNICTRNCAFCAVTKGKPAAVDRFEPERVVKAVENLDLKHVVITSPSRDDLADGGADIFAETAIKIKETNSSRKVEILIPDFSGSKDSIEKVCTVPVDILGHNIETVPSLYGKVRNGASYSRSLKVLRMVKELNGRIFTKSGLMLGLGETEEEVVGVLRDLRDMGCDFLTLGQYLAPSAGHFPVKEYVALEKFAYFAQKAYDLGFVNVKSSPYVRSSYLAHEFIED
jgi:lipoic acid synthetase